MTSYAYDSRNRLSVVEYPDRKEELFYDRAGNRTRRLTTGRDGIRKGKSCTAMISGTA